MPIAPLANIYIEDVDIDEVEKLLGGISFDKARRDVIKRLETFDVQAFPGTGKTTMLVAKLAILAKKWPYTNRGICVLSHTNVAREEIEMQLGSTEVGRKLLSYPHFIGTLHAFADTFIGLPWLKSKGFSVFTIDTEITLNRRWGKLSYSTRSYLERKGLSKYACESKGFPVRLEIGCSEQAPSYSNIKGIVEESFRDGFFTYDEMLYVARHAQAELSASLSKAIQMRFPALLVDEAQDTSTLQWKIIDTAFPDGSLSVVGSYGDCNQAIFQSHKAEEEGAIFPRRCPISIGNSKRFSNKIAQLVNPLSVAQGSMTGEQTAFETNDSMHTIFLYDRDKIAAVLPAYAEHILGCFTDDELQSNAKLGCHAIGMVHNEEPLANSDKKFPKSVVDYWAEYNPSVAGKTPSPRKLIEYFRLGVVERARTGDVGKMIQSVSKGICRYINASSDIRVSVSANAFGSLLRHIPVVEHNDFRAAFKRIVDSKISKEDEWNAVAAMVRGLVDPYFGITGLGGDYLEWVEPSQIAASEITANQSLFNCYTYKNQETGRSIDIYLGSIHSVKGRTHLSTLVFETFWHNHNITSLLAWLCAEPPRKKLGIRIEKRLKCHYVALTRAKGLICLALPKDLVDDKYISKLRSVGWSISVIG